MRFSSVLITGANGFVGRSLSAALLSLGTKVRGIDLTGTQNPATEHVTGSILDRALAAEAAKGAEAIIHLAAAHKDFGVPAEEYYEVNVEGTRNLLESASKHGIKTFIFFSSVAVYGPRADDSPVEEGDETRPLHDYGKSKLAAEQEILKWGRADADRQVLILRPTNIFGPENRHNLYRLIQTLDRRQFLRVGKLDGVKSIVYVGNVIAATLYLMNRLEPGLKTFNLVDEPSLTSWQIIEEVCKAGKFKLPRLQVPLSIVMPLGKVLDGIAKATGRDFPITGQRIKKLNTASHFSAKRLAKEGFVAPYSLQQGIRNTVEWYIKDATPPKAA